MSQVTEWKKSSDGELDRVQIKFTNEEFGAILRSFEYLNENNQGVDWNMAASNPEEVRAVTRFLKEKSVAQDDGVIVDYNRSSWMKYLNLLQFVCTRVLPPEHFDDADILAKLYEEHEDFEKNDAGIKYHF